MVIRDDKQAAFTATLPCVNCRYSTICKYYNIIEPIANVPDFMEVHYICKNKEEFDKGVIKEDDSKKVQI